MFEKHWIQYLLGVVSGGYGLLGFVMHQLGGEGGSPVIMYGSAALGAILLGGPSVQTYLSAMISKQQAQFKAIDPLPAPAVDVPKQPKCNSSDSSCDIPTSKCDKPKLTPKDREAALYRRFQDLVEAAEAAGCQDALDSFHNGWNQLFKAAHKIQAQTTPPADGKPAATA